MTAPQLNQPDPLAAARRHLDFEALAKGAPSVKSVLFKAQTIVPLVPAKPWERLGKAGATLGVLLVLLFAPVVPSTVQLALVKIQFENTFTRDEAQSVVLQAARNMPLQLLAAADFAVAPGQEDTSEDGRLTLRLASFKMKPEQLAEAALACISTAEGAQPFATPSTAAQLSRWQSIPSALLNRFRQDELEVSHFPAANALAGDIIDNAELFETALARHLAQSGYELESLTFVEYDTRQPKPVPEPSSFVLPAWPRWVSLSIAGYDELPSLEQQELRTRAAGFLSGLQLDAGGIMLDSEPTAALPVLLTVADRAGNLDPVATRRVQAEFGSLALAQPPFGKFEIESLVNAALVKVLDGLDYRVNYQQHSLFAPGQGADTYVATITISGKARQGLREFSMPAEDGAPAAEF